jgi:hypothetical protein
MRQNGHEGNSMKDEIEITPEMIEAGEAILSEHLEDWSSASLAIEVYRVMLAASVFPCQAD